MIPLHRWLQSLVCMAGYIGNYFAERSNHCYISWFFSPSTMVLFYRHHCWLLYFEVSLSFLLTDDCDRSFRSLLTSELIFWAILLSPYIIIVFLPEKWRGFTITVVDCYILKFSMIPSLCWLQPLVPMADSIGNYFSDRSNHCYISWLFLSKHNYVVLPSPLLIVVFWGFSVIPPHRWVQPLVQIDAYLVTT